MGWIGFFDPTSPPSNSIPLFAITSFAFIFDWVPDPVCQITKGKWSLNFPFATSNDALIIASPIVGSILPCLILIFAQAAFIKPSDLIIEIGCFSQPIGKLIIERCVCAPQYLSLGTFKSPKLSLSIL